MDFWIFANENIRRVKVKTTKIKRVISIAVFLGLAISLIPAGESGTTFAKRKNKKKKYTGTYENHVFKDKVYGFSIEISDDWNLKKMAEGKKIRFVAEKKEYAIPSELRNNELLTTAPMVKIFVDTSSLTPQAFMDSLKSKSFKSKQKSSLKNSLKIFDGRIKRPVVSRLKLKSKVKGVRARILRRYRLEVPRGVGEISDVVTDNVQGDLVFMKTPDNKHIIVLSGICESLYYRKINEAFFQEIYDSFKFIDAEDGK